MQMTCENCGPVDVTKARVVAEVHGSRCLECPGCGLYLFEDGYPRAEPAGGDDVHSEKRKAEVDAMLRRAIKAAQMHLPPGYGATLFAFPLDAPADQTRIFYISNATRSSMLAAVRTWLRRQPQ